MGKKSKSKRLKPEYLRKIGIPGVLITGMVFASIYGVEKLQNLEPDYEKNTRVFAYTGKVQQVIDGDTIRLYNGFDYRLVGINAPSYAKASEGRASLDKMKELVLNKKVWMEYDRYQDDKYGRILAWIWVDCEADPEFTPARYMHLSFNRSREGLMENPTGCKKGKLVQEEMVDAGLASVETYKKRGKLKYETRLEMRLSK